MHSTGKILKSLITLPDNNDSCWEWNGSVNKKTGYGKKQFDGKSILAHRWVYSIFNGHIPENFVLDHKCRNRRCVNPNHLQVVTQAVNCRNGLGAKLTEKLTEKQVNEIKNMLKTAKWGDREKIANTYNVSAGLISDIKYGRAWAD